MTSNDINIKFNNAKDLDNDYVGFGSIYIDHDYASADIMISNANISNNTAVVGTFVSFRATNYSEGNNFASFISSDFLNEIAIVSSPIFASSYFDITIDDTIIYNSITDGSAGIGYAIHSNVQLYDTEIENTKSYGSGSLYLEHSKGLIHETKFINNIIKYGYGACLYMKDVSRFVMFSNVL